jgi:hypothetical protein
MRFGEQRDGTHRGLEFVRDVGDEIVPDFLGARDLGAVIREQDDVFLPEHRCPHLHDDGPLPQRSTRQFELLFEDDAVTADSGRHVQQFLMDHGVAADQPVRVGGGTRADHTVHGVHHNKGTPDDGEHLRGAGRQGRLLSVHVQQPALLLADPVGEHAERAKRQADEACDQTDEHRIHRSTLCSCRGPSGAPGPPAPTVQLTFTCKGLTVYRTVAE